MVRPHGLRFLAVRLARLEAARPKTTPEDPRAWLDAAERIERLPDDDRRPLAVTFCLHCYANSLEAATYARLVSRVSPLLQGHPAPPWNPNGYSPLFRKLAREWHAKHPADPRTTRDRIKEQVERLLARAEAEQVQT